MDLSDLGTIRKLLNSYDQKAKKSFGQNFLIDKDILGSIIESAQISKTDHIIEVGPGLGVLTQKLAEESAKVTTIELDSSLLPILKLNLLRYKNVEIINGDALQFTPPSSEYKVVANIPYNITSPLINHFLKAENPPSSMTILVQKEVAEKICDLTPDMSFLSLQIALFATASIKKIVKAQSFYPVPKVDSAILNLETHKKYTSETAEKVLKIAKRAFAQGRKKLSNTLPEYKEQLEKLDIAGQRPQHLTIEHWLQLAA